MSTDPNHFVTAFYHPEGVSPAEGLTKREYFAGLAMQGMLANEELMGVIKSGARSMKIDSNEFFGGAAVEFADVLIEALNKETP